MVSAHDENDFAGWMRLLQCGERLRGLLKRIGFRNVRLDLARRHEGRDFGKLIAIGLHRRATGSRIDGKGIVDGRRRQPGRRIPALIARLDA